MLPDKMRYAESSSNLAVDRIGKRHKLLTGADPEKRFSPEPASLWP
jgi:hypothetical protein